VKAISWHGRSEKPVKINMKAIESKTLTYEAALFGINQDAMKVVVDISTIPSQKAKVAKDK